MQLIKSDRNIIVPALCLLVVSFLSKPAMALNFTNECENALTASDRKLFEEAADFVSRYVYAVEDHINDARLFGNPDRYSWIDPALMSDWRGVVADMQSGDVKIACEYNGMTFNTCERNPTKMGMESEIQPGRIHVCIDNVRQNAIDLYASVPNYPTPLPGSPVALLAGTIAHELMHIVDGFAVGHNGDTDPLNPDTAAETVGVAMEHLILTPDLDVAIRSVDINCCDVHDEATLTFDVVVKNMNAEAGAQARALSDQIRAGNAGSPTKGYTRNTRSLLLVEVDGVAQQRSVDALDGLESTTESFVFHIPAHEVAGEGIREILANADADNVFFESNEINNTDDATVGTSVDVSLDVEVAAPPVCHSMEYRGDVYPPGYYSWINIPYSADIINLDSQNTAPRVDIVMTYEDMWTESAMTSQHIVWSDSLPPQGSYAASFHLDIPTDPSCSGPLDATRVWFDADGNAETLNDVNRDNNSVYLVIDGDYWHPDYVIRDVAPVSLGRDTRTISYAVRNIGPVSSFTGGPSLISSTQVVDSFDTEVYFSAFTPHLAPGAQQTYQATLPVDDCDTWTYLIAADKLDAVDEDNELNNVTEIRLAPIAPGAICITPQHDGDDYEAELAWIQEHGIEVMYDKFDSLNTVEWGTDGGSSSNIGSNAPILDRIDP